METEEKIVTELKERGLTITTAESCTGGMLASTLINVPGISQIYREGYITYANESKESLLSVSRETLQAAGAVSPEVACQMAEGAAKRAGADVALSVTGIAGPEGGTESKPVGLVYIGCHLQGKTKAVRCLFRGSRQEIRQQTVTAALTLLWESLQQMK